MQSKACQIAAWPEHKEKCKLNRRMKDGPPEKADTYKALREFTSKHRPTLCAAGQRALEIAKDPSAARDKLLLVMVASRPAARTELKFYVTGADVVPFEMFGAAQAREMRGQLRLAEQQHRRNGKAGVFFVKLMAVDAGVANIAAVGFSKKIEDVPFEQMNTTWKDFLMLKLNHGIVD